MREETKIEQLEKRWIGLLRMKAAEYEHTARKSGKVVTEPSLDGICNEMEAFFAGLTK